MIDHYERQIPIKESMIKGQREAIEAFPNSKSNKHHLEQIKSMENTIESHKREIVRYKTKIKEYEAKIKTLDAKIAELQKNS